MIAPRIIVRHAPKPFPDFDYEAHWEGDDPMENRVGFGADGEEAQAALVENFPWEPGQ